MKQPTIEQIEAKLNEFGGMATPGKTNWCAQELYTMLQSATEPGDAYPNLSDIPEEDKAKIINKMVESVAKVALMTFYSMGLKTHIETTLRNDPTNENFVFSLRKSPTYKPLSELHLDREACLKIWEHVVGFDAEPGVIKDAKEYEFFTLWEFKPSYYDDTEPLHHIHIHYNGTVNWMKGEMTIEFNPFSLVALIQSLGYSA